MILILSNRYIYPRSNRGAVSALIRVKDTTTQGIVFIRNTWRSLFTNRSHGKPFLSDWGGELAGRKTPSLWGQEAIGHRQKYYPSLHSLAHWASNSNGQDKGHPSMVAIITAERSLTLPGCSQPFSRELLWLDTRPRGFWTLSAMLWAPIRKAGIGAAGTQTKELFLSDWK